MRDLITQVKPIFVPEQKKDHLVSKQPIFIISFPSLEKAAGHLDDKTAILQILGNIQQVMSHIERLFPIDDKSLYYPEIQNSLEEIDRHLEKMPLIGIYHGIRSSIQKAIKPLRSEIHNFLLEDEGLSESHLLAKTQALYVQQSLIMRNEALSKPVNEILAAVKKILPANCLNLRCFISYAWPTFSNQVKEIWLQPFLSVLHSHLNQVGILPLLDIIDNNKPGANIITYTHRIESVEYALLICSESLAVKHRDPQLRTMQIELSLLRQKYDRDTKTGQVRVFPLLVSGSRATSLLPEHYLFRSFYDWRNQSYLKNLEQLIGLICYPQGVSETYKRLWHDFYTAYPLLADVLPEELVSQELSYYWHRNQMKALGAKGFYQNLLAQQYTGIIKSKTTDAKLDIPTTVASSYALPKVTKIFIGRTDLLELVDKYFSPDPKEFMTDESSNEPKLLVCHGLGGVGKTQLALQYAHHAKKKYKHCYWFLAKSVEVLANCYRQFAREMNLIGDDYHSDEQIIIAVKQWQRSNPGWLFIYDDVTEYAHLEPYLPSHGAGDILFTTRLAAKKWPKDISSILVDVLSPSEAKLLVSSLLDLADDKDIPKLTVLMGYLPLAIVQACAYIREKQISIARYLEIYTLKSDYLLKQGDTPPGFTPHDPVFTTWDINLEAIAAEEKAKSKNTQAKQLLKVCAFLNDQKIPYSILQEAYRCLYPVTNEPFEESLSRLQSYSLIQTDEANRSIQMHCLVQQATHGHLDSKEKNDTLLQLMDVLHFLNPLRSSLSSKAIQIRRNLLPHFESIKMHIKSLMPPALKLIHFLNDIGTLLHRLENNPEALKYHTEAMTLQNDNSDTFLAAQTFRYMGDCYFKSDSFPEAEKHYEQSLGKLLVIKSKQAIRDSKDQEQKQILTTLFFKPDSEDRININREIGGCYNGLGITYDCQGKNDEAVYFLEQGVKIREQIHSQNEIFAEDLATSYCNLATAYFSLMQIKKSFDYYNKALNLLRNLHAASKGSSEIANVLYNLSICHLEMDNIDQSLTYLQMTLFEAENCCSGTLQIGNYHHQTGLCYFFLGKYPEAAEHCKISLDIIEKYDDAKYKIYGIKFIYYLAIEAKKHFKMPNECTKILDNFKKEYGEQDLTYIGMIYCLGIVHIQQKDFDIALAYLKESLRLREKINGKNTYHYYKALIKIADVYEAKGDRGDALINYQKALDFLEEIKNKTPLKAMAESKNASQKEEIADEYIKNERIRLQTKIHLLDEQRLINSPTMKR